MLFSPPPDTYFLTLTQVFSLSTCCNTNPAPPFAPLLSHGRQNETEQHERCGEKRGKRVYSSIPFLFFFFLLFVCFFLTRSRKRRKREGTTTKKEDFMKPLFFRRERPCYARKSAKWELSFFAQIFPLSSAVWNPPSKEKGGYSRNL